MHKKGIGFVVLGVVGVFTILGVLASSNRVFATQTCTTDNETGVVTCNDSITASVIVETSCGFTITGDGNYTLTLANNSTNNINGSQFTTTCNSPNGYALYAVGFSGNQVGNTKLLAQTIGSTYDIQTGSGSSNWKMNLTSTGSYGTVVPAYDAGTGTTKNYADIPASYTKVAYYTPASGDASTQSVFQTNYQATVSSTQPADNYVGQVKYTLVPTSESISKSIFELEYMQDFASLTSAQKADVLTSMITNEQYQLKDSRDNKVYYISKLTDGNVWMTQNLDLDIDSTKTYTSADTDILEDWNPISSTQTTTTWAEHYNSPESYDPGDVCWNGSIGSSITTTCDQSSNHYSLGNYYNWAAAIASNDSSSHIEGIATSSICPRGWKLPVHEGNGSYANLINMLGLVSGTSGNIQNSPTFFTYGGAYWEGIFGGIGDIGTYWSSVPSGIDNQEAYAFAFNSGGEMPIVFIGRYNGFPIRCVLR